MTHLQSVAVTAQATFGRDGAMFEGLLDFVAQLSLVLDHGGPHCGHPCIGIPVLRRRAARTALVETVAPSAAVPASTAAIDLVQPAAVAASVMVPRRAARNRRAESRPAGHVPALAGNSHRGVSMDLALVIFWLFAVVSILYVVHFGLFLVGANFYDVWQQRRKGMRGVRLPPAYEAECAATATWTRRALPEVPQGWSPSPSLPTTKRR